jgi:hypothetical protein
MDVFECQLLALEARQEVNFRLNTELEFTDFGTLS